MPEVEPELALFQIQVKGMFGNAVELRQPAFGNAPERLNAIDVMLSSDEFVVAVVDPELLVKADVHQPVVAPRQPSVWMTLLMSALPRMMACSVALEALGTISV